MISSSASAISIPFLLLSFSSASLKNLNLGNDEADDVDDDDNGDDLTSLLNSASADDSKKPSFLPLLQDSLNGV